MTTNPRAYVGTSDIARLAGINRATVSNWRRRGVGFPEPVAGNPARPLFDLDAVTAWLEDRGIPVGSAPDHNLINDDSLATQGQSGSADSWGGRGQGRGDGRGKRRGAGRRGPGHEGPGHDGPHGRGDRGGRGHGRPGGRGEGRGPGRRFEDAFRLESILRASLKPHDARRLIIELTALKALERRGELGDLLGESEDLRSGALAAAEAVRSENEALAGTFTDLARYLDDSGVARSAQLIWAELDQVEKLDRLARVIGRSIGDDRFGSPEHVSSPLVAKLLAGLAQDTGPSASRAVLGAGTGQVISRLDRKVGGDLIGWDNSEEAVELAAARLAIAGSDARVEVRDLMVNPPLGKRYSAVVCDAPFGLRTPRDVHEKLAEIVENHERTSEAYWVALTRELLAAGGRGAVVLPLAAWEKLGARESLLTGGHVEAVISLPRHTMPSFEGRSVVLVLRGGSLFDLPVGARWHFLNGSSNTLFVDVESAFGAEAFEGAGFGPGAGAGAGFGPGAGRGPARRRMNGLSRHAVSAVVDLVLSFRENPTEFAEGRVSADDIGHDSVRAAVVRTESDVTKLADPRQLLGQSTPQMRAKLIDGASRNTMGLARGLRRVGRRVDLAEAGERLKEISQDLAQVDANEFVFSEPTSLGEMGVPVHAYSADEEVEDGDILVLPGAGRQVVRFKVVTERMLERRAKGRQGREGARAGAGVEGAEAGAAAVFGGASGGFAVGGEVEGAPAGARAGSPLGGEPERGRKRPQPIVIIKSSQIDVDSHVIAAALSTTQNQFILGRRLERMERHGGPRDRGPWAGGPGGPSGRGSGVGGFNPGQRELDAALVSTGLADLSVPRENGETADRVAEALVEIERIAAAARALQEDARSAELAIAPLLGLNKFAAARKNRR
ncbi:methyltransferase domain-containing protein [Timonella senegalensis]|uniref:methyltransferase domain-containing protein n=1 Tax=Timonella senegalensis TaxID=1465825 RepID=UPI0002D9D53A|nr:methyltransferase domain-containing protein [Timonella senegalensis]